LARAPCALIQGLDTGPFTFYRAVHIFLNDGATVNDEARDLGPEPLPERRISDVETIKALSDPLRLRILELMTAAHRETFTVKRLATSLAVSQTKLYHHVNLLVERELIQPAGQRVVSGIIETSYRIGQLKISLDRSLLAADSPQLHDVLATVFDGARDDIERGLRSGVIRVGEDAVPNTKLLVSKGLARLSPEQAIAFRARLTELIEEYDTTDSTVEAQPYGLVLGFYPMPDLASAEDDQ
jgi:DNA-binding transcriptional ArsR family regulator